MKKAKNPLITLEEAKARKLKFPDPKPVACPYCGNVTVPLGIVMEGEVKWVTRRPCGCPEERRARDREEEEKSNASKRRFREKLLNAGIGRRFLNAEVSLPASAEYLSAFEGSAGSGLYIEGCGGSGKTYAASALARAFVTSGYTVAMGTAVWMLEEVKRSFDDDTSSGTERFCTCDVLVIDDIGKEVPSSWALTTLFLIVNARYEGMLPTIYTSQYDIDSLLARMRQRGERESAEAIVSRIIETSTFVRLPKRDRRREKMRFSWNGD